MIFGLRRFFRRWELIAHSEEKTMRRKSAAVQIEESRWRVACDMGFTMSRSECSS
jgi:hypothetical protein